ncbi:hypothetical protein BRDID11004_21120 [Bradyrhizobium diazoefficiens]|uniref:Uncharacterized protein n=1 Tax=Bradyrhizobium diazoefficiens TaxID=1355477 RepID=A0A810A3H3_9BRAD|nr:hypothetical protein BDHF08_65110 [Bradyrhizobium diazoefficiens]BCE59074.1 hypothetical protein XF5B_65860 [Bradyrhizobium diazoefficiens]
MGAVSPGSPPQTIRMISAKKALIARPVPIRSVPAQLGFKILDDAMKQTRGKRVGHFPFQTPITRDPGFLLSQLVLCHQTGPPANRRADSQTVSLKFSDHLPWFPIG